LQPHDSKYALICPLSSVHYPRQAVDYRQAEFLGIIPKSYPFHSQHYCRTYNPSEPWAHAYIHSADRAVEPRPRRSIPDPVRTVPRVTKYHNLTPYFFSFFLHDATMETAWPIGHFVHRLALRAASDGFILPTRGCTYILPNRGQSPTTRQPSHPSRQRAEPKCAIGLCI
jgi:hypothetical protein